MRSTAVLALLLAVASCDKANDKDKKDETGSAQAAALDAGVAVGSAVGSGTAVAPPVVVAAPDAGAVVAEAGTGPTGNPVCDELILRSRCMHQRLGKNMPQDTVKTFEAGIDAWKLGLANEASRGTVIQSCQASLDGAMAGFAQLDCGGDLGELAAKARTDADATATTGTGTAPPPTAAGESVGAAECDELIARSRCTFKLAGSAMPAEAVKGFEDSVKTWKDALAAGGASRAATIDACKMGLEAGKTGYEMSGCAGAELGALLPAMKDAPKTAGGAVPDIAPMGEPTCDKLVERTMCTFKKAGSNMPAEAVKAFADGVDQWREMLKNSSVRQAIIDACKQSLDAGDAGYKQMGC